MRDINLDFRLPEGPQDGPLSHGAGFAATSNGQESDAAAESGLSGFPAPASPTSPAPERTVKRRKRSGFYVKTRPDGSVAWDSLDPQAQAKLEGAAVAKSKAAAPQVQFSPAECGFFYAILGELEARVAVATCRCPVPLARQFFQYSGEELEQLSGPTSRVLSKHGGEFLDKWHDEIVLLFALASIHQRKLSDFAAALAEHRKQAKPRVVPSVSIGDFQPEAASG